MRVHFVIHETFEAPGAYETWARDRGHSLARSRIYDREPLPGTVDDIDLLVVFGGPQSPATTTDECEHFDAAAEMGLIHEAVSAGKAVVGVCLGAQLVGEALGARYDHSPHKEIGSFPITLTDEGKRNDKFSHFGDALEVGHWHGDMPGLTDGAVVIAQSEGCPRQIVEYTKLVYGFQCHMEFTPEVVELLIQHSERELVKVGGLGYVQSPEQLRANDYREMNEKLCGFLDKLSNEHLRSAR